MDATFFLGNERDLNLMTNKPLGEARMVSLWDSASLTRPPFEAGSLESFYRLQRQTLLDFLVEKGIYQSGELAKMAFVSRVYANPELGQSVQRLCGKRSDPEFIIHPIDVFKKGETITLMVYRLDYDLERVDETLSTVLSVSTGQRFEQYPDPSLDLPALSNIFDNLLYDVRREVPTFVPNM